MPEKLSDIEIEKAAWKEFLSGAQSAYEDWADEDDEYPDDTERRVFDRMGEILEELKERHL